MNYGLPYKGSKNKIAEKILEVLPSADNFYDLFAGGCAITHCAILSQKYKNFYINDIQKQYPQLFIDAINGKHKNEKRVITRDDFEKLKDTDALVATCWSFGNNCKNYLWNDITAGAKQLACKIILGDTVKERRTAYMEFIKYLQNNSETNFKKMRLQDIDSLSRLQSLQSLQSNIVCTGLDYRDIEIKENSVIYCDIPYEGTCGYGVDFCHSDFWTWCRNNAQAVFVSSYKAPEDFVSVLDIEKTCSYSSSENNKKTTEKLFVHKRFAEVNHG